MIQNAARNFGPKCDKFTNDIIKLLKFGIFSKIVEKKEELDARIRQIGRRYNFG